MKRRYFTLCSAASLLLLVSIVFLNWRSRTELVSLAAPLHQRGAAQSIQSGGLTTYLVDACRGRIRFALINPVVGDLPWRPSERSLMTWPVDSPQARTIWGIQERAPRVTHFAWDGMGCVVYSGRAYAASKDPLAAITIPIYALTFLAALLPASWISVVLHQRWADARRRRLCLCPACGYDLRATPDRCRECGAVPNDPASAAIR